MGFLIAVVVMAIGFMALAGLIGLVSFTKDAEKIKKMEADPDAALAALFDGSDQVVYAPRDSSGGLTTTTLVKGASECGYRLVQESGQMGTRTVVFEKVNQA